MLSKETEYPIFFHVIAFDVPKFVFFIEVCAMIVLYVIILKLFLLVIIFIVCILFLKINFSLFELCVCPRPSKF